MYLSKLQKQELIDKFDSSDIIELLELDIEETIELLEHLIIKNLDRFDLYDSSEARQDDET